MQKENSPVAWSAEPGRYGRNCALDHSEQIREGQQAQKFAKLRPRSKRAGVLRAFLDRGDRGMNCFESVRLAHDYVLRSSISDFRRHFGIEFHKRYEAVPGHNGGKVECVRYWLTPAGAELARRLLSESGAA